MSDRRQLLADYEAYEALSAKIASTSHDALTEADLHAIVALREQVARRQSAVGHEIVARMVDEETPASAGISVREMMVNALRISRADAARRIADAQQLGPRRAFTGEPLPPKLPTTAAILARGEIGDEHVRLIQKFFKKLPNTVSAEDRDRAEVLLAESAARVTPEDLAEIANRLLVTIDEDGPEPKDKVRARRRGVWFSPPDSDGMSGIHGYVDPETRGLVEAGTAKLAAPGMCDPEDDEPRLDGEPDEDAARRDTRNPAQRMHDALRMIFRAILASGKLGQHRGLPATLLVTASLDQITSGEGWAVTGSGSLLPMSDVIRLASHAHHYLCIYDSHTQIPLYLGRSKRIASTGQRLALFGMEGGCSRPGCTVPADRCQVHHRDRDWVDGGRTDINELTLACPTCHRLLTSHGWRTRIGKDGRTEWIPPAVVDPPLRDTG